MRQSSRSIENVPWAFVTPASAGATYCSTEPHIAVLIWIFCASGPLGRLNSIGSDVSCTCGAKWTVPPLTDTSSGSICATPLARLALMSAGPSGKPYRLAPSQCSVAAAEPSARENGPRYDADDEPRPAMRMSGPRHGLSSSGQAIQIVVELSVDLGVFLPARRRERVRRRRPSARWRSIRTG